MIDWGMSMNWSTLLNDVYCFSHGNVMEAIKLPAAKTRFGFLSWQSEDKQQ